jgi:hypothetical protein
MFFNKIDDDMIDMRREKMISRSHQKLWQKFERDQAAAEVPDYHRNLRYFEALYQEAQLMSVLPGTEPLAGLEVDVRIAAVVARPLAERI